MPKMTLKAIRVNNSLTQDEIANRIGVSKFTWANWENGKSFPDVPYVDKIIKEFNVAYSDIKFLTETSV